MVNCRFEVEWCCRSLAYRQDIPVRTATSHLVLATSLERSGKHEPGLSELKQGRKILESGFDDGLKHGKWDRGLWFDRVFARVPLREASELLQNKLDSAQ
jgi:hypothetical protein